MNRLKSAVILLAVAALPLLLASCGEIRLNVPAPDAGEDSVVDIAALELAEDVLTPDTAAQDKPPVVKIAKPVDGFIANVGEMVHFAATVSDDHDTEKLTFVLKSNNKELAKGNVPAAGLYEFDSAALPAGGQKLKLEVTDTAGNMGSAEVSILINTAPGAPSVAIEPATPTVADALVAKIVTPALDADRVSSQLTYSYLWTKNGVATAEIKDTVAAGLTKKGETWVVKVKANDPAASGAEATAQVVIGNSAPATPTVAIEPADVDLKSAVQCKVGAENADPDGDALTYTYSWSVNGYINVNVLADKIKIDDLYAKLKVPIKAGDKVKCIVVSNDGDLASIPGESTEITVKPFDVCASQFNPCDPAAACSNTDTLDPTCTCAGGYTGDGKICLDIDECAGGFCDLNADCTNTAGSYTCGCKNGFIGDGKSCSDVDECANGSAGCDLAASCSNTVGSYVCSCNLGYKGSGKVCGDVDECALGTGGCDLAANCSNTVGGNVCTCKSGYNGDGKKCEDVDECKTNNGGCSSDGLCTNIPGANLCVCNAGFSGDGAKCVDVDECKLGTAQCSTVALCANTPGTYTCACNAGYLGDGKTCADVNECLVANGGCALTADCTNKPGTFTCACKSGYSGDGKACVDIDECAKGTAGCAVQAVCANSIGSYTCTCKPGFQGDGKSCSTIDLCPILNGGCDLLNGKCSMVNDKVQCSCKAGYSGTGITCSDVNECLVNNGGCSATAICGNTMGSFTCACKPGYSGDGLTCTDVNECAVNNGGCSGNASCTNTVGSFACACKAGFVGDGKICTDVNECLVNNGGCKANATCTNLPGSSSCACNLGYNGDPKVGCVDVNECLANNGGCDVNAGCSNTVGSFICKCNAGFNGNGVTCLDINECLSNNGGCSLAADCTNTAGSYACACKPGYQGDGKLCVDIDECPPVNWTWNFTTQSSIGWVLDAPSVVGTLVNWKILGGNLYYGNGTNFDTPGQANHGNATGPVIQLSNNPQHKISFDADFQTEFGNYYDRLYVQLVIALPTGPQVITVWDKTKQVQNTPGQLINYTFTVAGYAGKQVQLRFAFDTIDAIGNGGKGVTINNLSIRGFPSPCLPNANCTNIVGSYNCTCDGTLKGDGKTSCVP